VKLHFPSFVLNVVVVLALGMTVWRAAPLISQALRPAKAPAVLLRPGVQLALPTFNWSQAQRHVVLLLRPTCEACRQSLGFYKTLSAKSKAIAGVRTMVLSPDPIEAVQRWLTDAQVSVDEVIQIRDPAALGFTVYPTLLITEINGAVTDILVNRLTDAEQVVVWPRLAGKQSAIPLDNTEYPQEISPAQLDDVLAAERGRVQMVDIRDRETFAKGSVARAINLPDAELATRARVELLKSDPVVIVCYPREATRCRSAGRRLKALGFDRVMVSVQ
jgi:rhodanese-related sulfurtransferase